MLPAFVTKENSCQRKFVLLSWALVKTDFATGRLLNLDATYENIIKPAVELTGYRCIRADDINHSGVIDLHMYKMLLIADLVIADISTTNANALYELGVRHALKNKTTIILSEDQSALHFDLNHVATIQYQHNGDDISASESTRIINRLKELLKMLLKEMSLIALFIPFTKITDASARSTRYAVNY